MSWLRAVAAVLLIPAVASAVVVQYIEGPSNPGVGGCREHWVEWVENSALKATPFTASGVQMVGIESQYVKSSSSDAWGDCWKWSPTTNLFDVEFDSANGSCSVPSNVWTKATYYARGVLRNQTTQTLAQEASMLMAIVSDNDNLAMGSADVIASSGSVGISDDSPYLGLYAAGGFSGVAHLPIDDNDRIGLWLQEVTQLGVTNEFLTAGYVRFEIQTTTCMRGTP